MPSRKAPRGWKDYWRPGEMAYFEYHCEESDESCDAEIWYRSRQPVIVLRIVEPGGYRTFRDRAYWGMPRLYRVRFLDGLEWDVFEDELVTSERYYDPAFEPGERRAARTERNIVRLRQWSGQ